MKRLGVLTLFATAALSSGFGSCAGSIHTACSSYFPRAQEELLLAKNQLETYSSERTLASEGNHPDYPDYKEWMKWSVDRLEEAQHLIDDADEDPSYRPIKVELSEAAKMLVEFYGYAKNGRTRDMTKTLAKISSHGEKARSLACDK